MGDASGQSYKGAHIWTVLSFSYNHADARKDITLTTSSTWSICVDFQLVSYPTHTYTESLAWQSTQIVAQHFRLAFHMLQGAIATAVLWGCRVVSSSNSAFRRSTITLLAILFSTSFLIRYLRWDMKSTNFLVAASGATLWSVMPRHVWEYLTSEYKFGPLAHPLSTSK